MWNRQLQLTPEAAEFARSQFQEGVASATSALFSAMGSQYEPFACQATPMRLSAMAEKLSAGEEMCAAVLFGVEGALRAGLILESDAAQPLEGLPAFEALAREVCGESAKALGYDDLGEATFVFDMAATALREASAMSAKDYGVVIWDRLKSKEGWALRFVVVTQTYLEQMTEYAEAA